MGLLAPAAGAQEADDGAPPETGAGEPQSGCKPDVPGLNYFERSFTDTAGGGTVVGWARSTEVTVDRLVVSGEVTICYQDVEVKADRIELRRESKVVVAEGNVTFDQGPRRLTGQTLEFDLEAGTGRFTHAHAYVATDYFFEGAEIAKVAEDTYTVTDGIFTSCEGEVPPWSFKVRSARVTVDGYARLRGAALRTKNVPIFYLPYILWPARSERSSGFLVPKPGYSSRRGASLGLAYYQVLGRSYDTTFELDLFSRGAESGEGGNYIAFGNEFRYRPGEATSGRFQGYVIRDPEFGQDPQRDETRWRVLYDHESNDLPAGMRGVIHIEDVSDIDFFRDFERTLDNNARSRLYSNAFLSGNWGVHSFNVRFDQAESFQGPNSSIVQRNLPAVEYRLRQTRLGPTPLYLQLGSSVNYLDVDRGPRLDAGYARANLFPELTLALSSFPWLSFSATVGSRFTWYGDSLVPLADRGAPDLDSDFSGESLSRLNATAGAEIVGPSFSRVFEGRGRRLKHIVEPRFTYAFRDDFDDQVLVNRFDQVDSLVGEEIGEFKLINRLMVKPTDGAAREVLSLQLSQQFALDDEALQRSSPDPDGVVQMRSAGPVRALLSYRPSRRTSVRFDTFYSTLFSRIQSTAFSGSFALPRESNLRLTWRSRRNPEDNMTLSNQMQLATRLSLLPRKLSLFADVHYDVEGSSVQRQRYFLDYKGSCYGLSLEWAEFKRQTGRDSEYRFAVTLKNVGSFFDITGGSSDRF